MREVVCDDVIKLFAPGSFPANLHSACRVEVCGRIVTAPCFRVILPDSDESCVPISIGSIEFNDGRSFRCVDVTRTVVISESRQSRPSVPSHYRCIVITATIYFLYTRISRIYFITFARPTSVPSAI